MNKGKQAARWLMICGLLVAGVAVGLAQQGSTARPAQQPRSGTPPDISGFWEVSFDSRRVPPATLTSGVTKAMIEAQAKKDRHAIRWCNVLGMPFIMDSGRPLDIRQGKRAIVIQAEAWSNARHIYLDRTAHVDPEIFDPTTTGDSVARWEGDTLVVDTIGMDPAKGLTAIPGGGFRTASTHLVERYRLLNSRPSPGLRTYGPQLSVTFTWEDPKVFRTPHTYEFRYYRLPSTYEPAPLLPCDPYDEERARWLN